MEGVASAAQHFDLWRLGGSIMGTMLAFLIAWPVDRRDFITRMIVSLVCGIVFDPVLRNYFDWPNYPRLVLAASLLCSMFAWSAIGALMRIIKSIDKLPK